MWPVSKLPRIRRADAEPKVKPGGFAESLSASMLVVERQPIERLLGARDEQPPETPQGSGLAQVSGLLPFESTGPHGHRGRMRDKLLTRGPDALADYELLEMLLYFAMPRGDTKPLAKALINRYGSFANVLAAPKQALLETRGLGVHSVAALKLVQAAALRLAQGEVIERPILDTWNRLLEYLTAAMAREKTEVFRVLFLDSKNRLIAAEALGSGPINLLQRRGVV